jgi:hypothetical protein
MLVVSMIYNSTEILRSWEKETSKTNPMKLLILFISILSFVGCFESRVKHFEANVSKMCIEEHVYFVTTSTYSGGIAPKLTDDGKPVECKDEPGIK